MLIDSLNLAEGSVNQNVQMPNVTVAQQAALTNLDIGEIVYVTDAATPGLQVWDGAAWAPVGGSVDLSGYVATSQLGIASGVATLDSNAKVPTTQLPDSILGQLEYQGTWDFANALPAASASNKGYYYVASNATAQNGYVMGDWAVSNGASWDKIDNTDAVQSVAGRTGAVTLTKSDVGLANVDNTSDANKPVSTATQTALNAKADVVSVPMVTKTASYNTTSADAGYQINTNSALTITDGTLTSGKILSVYNNSAAAITVTFGTSYTANYKNGSTTAIGSSASVPARSIISVMAISNSELFVTGL